jgi:hypothetical protein
MPCRTFTDPIDWTNTIERVAATATAADVAVVTPCCRQVESGTLSSETV